MISWREFHKYVIPYHFLAQPLYDQKNTNPNMGLSANTSILTTEIKMIKINNIARKLLSFSHYNKYILNPVSYKIPL